MISPSLTDIFMFSLCLQIVYLTQYVINSHFIIYSFFHLLNKIIIFVPDISLIKNYCNIQLSDTVQKIRSQSSKPLNLEISVTIHKSINLKYSVRNLDLIAWLLYNYLIQIKRGYHIRVSYNILAY